MEDITVGSLGNEHELVCASYLHHCGGVDKKSLYNGDNVFLHEGKNHQAFNI
jgi:hypothetical protein